MRAVYVYNPHNAKEVELIDRVKKEMKNYVELFSVEDFADIKDIIPIKTTPALILLREDLQGEHLTEDIDGQLRVTGEVAKALEEEEEILHGNLTKRVDKIIKQEAEKIAVQLQKKGV